MAEPGLRQMSPKFENYSKFILRVLVDRQAGNRRINVEIPAPDEVPNFKPSLSA
jgi:hypothetical protein